MAVPNDPTADNSNTPLDKKSTWEGIITMTPVVMAIVATVLAGLSSSEMTQAQYHRSLAGQNQSKAGDQWGFFQAKRIRGNQMENEVDLLPVTSRAGPLKPGILKAATARLARILKETKSRAEALRDAAKEKKQAEVEEAANEFLEELKKNPPEGLVKTVTSDLEKNKDVFQYLGTRKLPPPPPEDPERKEVLADPQLKECIAALIDRKTEEEIAPIIRKVKGSTLRTAIHAAELHAKQFEDSSEPTNKQVTGLAIAMSGPIRLAALYQNLVITAEALMPEAAEGGDSMKDPVKAAATVNATLKSAAENLNSLIKSAQHDYTARRYRAEAGNNLNTALLYEVQVHRSDADSNSHRKRSSFFFFGMLGAQCGVAIGSIALAARRKSLLWFLAAFAGLVAIGFSGYVYLSL